MRIRPLVVLVILVAPVAGCGESPPPQPDGSSGVRGVCLLPAKHGGGERGRWAGAEVTFQTAPADGKPLGEHKVRARADANGEFRVALNPGRYWVGLYDPKLMKGKAVSGFPDATVEGGRYADLVIDFEQLKIEDVK